MADNYLERKMEEHRRLGKSPGVKTPRTLANRPGCIQVKFQPRRVFVNGGGSTGLGREIVTSFRNAECKVAFFDNNRKEGYKTAQDTGARFYPSDAEKTDLLQRAMCHTMTDWDGIDILVNICDDRLPSHTEDYDTANFSDMPAASASPVYTSSNILACRIKANGNADTYGGRIINICAHDSGTQTRNSDATAASKGTIIALTETFANSLRQYGATANSIYVYGDGAAWKEAARLCLYLSLPESMLNGENITIGPKPK